MYWNGGPSTKDRQTIGKAVNRSRQTVGEVVSKDAGSVPLYNYVHRGVRA